MFYIGPYCVERLKYKSEEISSKLYIFWEMSKSNKNHVIPFYQKLQKGVCKISLQL